MQEVVVITARNRKRRLGTPGVSGLSKGSKTGFHGGGVGWERGISPPKG